MHQTVHEAFAEACDQRPDHPFIVVPAAPERPYLPRGETFSYRQVQQQVRALEDAYSAAGFGLGHRVALLLENRPAHFLHLLALNALGASIVPINPDYRADEIGYLLEHSGADLVVALEPRVPSLREIAAHSTKSPAVVPAESLPGPLPSARSRANAGRPDRSTEAALLYTSGTTARPKGCVLSNDYHFAVGETYLNYGGLATLRAGAERAYNPLPLFHMNAGIFSFMGMLLSGGCVIVPDRFHPSRFWSELAQTGATIVHYLGVIPPILLKRAPAPEDRAHRVRFGVGAGIEPELHDAFEHRFGFPLLELWGMTETGGGFMAATEPRETHTRAFGRPDRDMLARVIDEQGQEVRPGVVGELTVRRRGPNPRRGFFTEYLKNPEATAEAWRTGWFHTGDLVRQDASGMLYFVDRMKNIIRRSGENIAAAEIEATLLAHPEVGQAAVVAVPDAIRDEEVFACVVPAAGVERGTPLADRLFAHCMSRLAYFKAPGWVLFMDTLPVTGTQKVQKGQLFGDGEDPRARADAIDLRERKKRTSQ